MHILAVGWNRVGSAPYPGESPYRLAAGQDTFDPPDTATSVFNSVDQVVHKGTLGVATIDLSSHQVEYHPIGPLLPKVGFQLSPDRMVAAGSNRGTEWWVWDIEHHKFIKKNSKAARRSSSPTAPDRRGSGLGDPTVGHGSGERY